MLQKDFQRKGFVVWGVCTIFFLYEFLLRTVMGTYQHPVMYDFHLTSLQFSLLSTTLFLVVYGLMQIPVGLIVSRIGLKKGLLLAAFTCALSAFGFAFTHKFLAGTIYRMFMGFGASFGFISMLISIYEWMPRRYTAIFIGISQFIGTLGPMLAAGPLDSLSETSSMNWRSMFLLLSGVGVILFFLILFFVENNKEKAGRFLVLKRPQPVNKSIKKLFARQQPWIIALVSASLYFCVEYLSENEARAFLGLKGISLNTASYMISVSWIGYAMGCPLLGFLSDVFERRKIFMSSCAFLGLAGILVFLYSHHELYLSIAFFLIGFSASGQSIGFATMAEQFKKETIAVGFGLNNALITVVSAINAPVIASILDYLSQTHNITLFEYISAFKILVGIFVFACVISVLFIKETYTKSLVDFTYLKPA